MSVFANRPRPGSCMFTASHLDLLTYKSPAVSEYYLHGFDQLNDGAVMYSAIAAMLSGGTDAMLLRLLEDDRLGLSCESIEAELATKLESLEAVDDYTWSRLAQLVPETSANSLKDKTLHSYHISRAFVQTRSCRWPDLIPGSCSMATGKQTSRLY